MKSGRPPSWSRRRFRGPVNAGSPVAGRAASRRARTSRGRSGRPPSESRRGFRPALGCRHGQGDHTADPTACTDDCLRPEAVTHGGAAAQFVGRQGRLATSGGPRRQGPNPRAKQGKTTSNDGSTACGVWSTARPLRRVPRGGAGTISLCYGFGSHKAACPAATLSSWVPCRAAAEAVSPASPA